jgi:hypothetical protein
MKKICGFPPNPQQQRRIGKYFYTKSGGPNSVAERIGLGLKGLICTIDR